VALAPINELTVDDVGLLCDEHAISGLRLALLSKQCAGHVLAACESPSDIMASLGLSIWLPDTYVECARLFVLLGQLREFHLPSTGTVSRPDIPADVLDGLCDEHCGKEAALELKRLRVTPAMLIAMDPILLSICLVTRPTAEAILRLQRAVRCKALA
jgi:hypothetical protein